VSATVERSSRRSPAVAGGPKAWTAVGPRDAQPIVFLHGTRLTRAQWYPQLRRLADRYRCIAVDLPGHGTQADEPFTIAAATRTICEAIESEAGGRPAVLVGLSLGGYIAIDAAEASPELVAGLVLAGCSAEPVGALSWPFRVLASILERAPGRALDAANRTFFRALYGGPTADGIVAGGFWSAGGAAALRTLVGRRYLDRLSRLWTRVLIVNGALDPVFGPQGDYWAGSCRQGRHVVLGRAVHLSNLDRPRAFSALVAGFADRVARGD